MCTCQPHVRLLRYVSAACVSTMFRKTPSFLKVTSKKKPKKAPFIQLQKDVQGTHGFLNKKKQGKSLALKPHLGAIIKEYKNKNKNESA